MSALDILVYECPHGHREKIPADDVAPPEAHLEGTEHVYCNACGEDRYMTFKGLLGLSDGTYVFAEDETSRYCPTCRGPCMKPGVSFHEHGDEFEV
jgi:NAD-dependent SIR2 family protein deacetylase